MSHRAALLDLERRKLALLRNRLEEQERRVQMLEGMTTDDPLDALLERELAPSAAAMQTPAPLPASADDDDRDDLPETLLPPAPLPPTFSWGSQPRFPRQVPAIWVHLLKFIGREGRTYEQVTKFIEVNKIALSPGAARTQLMNYRKEFAFVDNPRKGFYKATDRALAFIEQQEARARQSESEAGAVANE